MGSQTERGQVIVETAISMALITMLMAGAIALTLLGHRSAEKYEYKTDGRKSYDTQLEQSQRAVEFLDHGSQ